jgi:hypothetical protein
MSASVLTFIFIYLYIIGGLAAAVEAAGLAVDSAFQAAVHVTSAGCHVSVGSSSVLACVGLVAGRAPVTASFILFFYF